MPQPTPPPQPVSMSLEHADQIALQVYDDGTPTLRANWQQIAKGKGRAKE